MKAILDEWLAGRIDCPTGPMNTKPNPYSRNWGCRFPVASDWPRRHRRSGIPGPVVAKVCSADIMHKTDLKGVYLNLGPDNLSVALEALHNAFPEASILVEEMVASEGPEMIAGGLIDPGFGPAVMVGAGGILTEIAQDVTFRLAPLDEAEACRMLMELKIYPVFEGFRGLHLDPAPLARLLVTVSRLVDALGSRFDQLDLNPIVWSHAGWTILDAKLMLRTWP